MGNDYTLLIKGSYSIYFNPRSRVGNDLSIPQVSIYNIQFQSTFPRGERRYFKIRELRKRQFQSTFPRGERLHSPRKPCFFIRISIHVPAWGTTLSILQNTSRTPYFNPRSRVGNDSKNGANDLKPWISIHVPAWGTTGTGYYYPGGGPISIHVPAWGTTETIPNSPGVKKFQSTFPRGERQLRQDSLTIQIQFQSTFPRGERPVVLGAGLAITADFNPRSRVGNDEGGASPLDWIKGFQSTFPRGERPNSTVT